MSTYAVQRTLPGITPKQLGGAQKAAMDTCTQMSAEGTEVRYIRSNFYPDSAKCTCLFEAPDAETVKQLNDRAALPYDSVEAVMDLLPAE